MDEQTNLFDYMEADQHLEKEKALSGRIDVVKLQYLEAESVIWQDLFQGYKKLRAITYSSGIDFIYRLLEMFDQAEIIFGCEEVMSYSLNEIFAYQSKLIERLREKVGDRKKQLLDRIDQGSVHFYVARKQLSHEKIYLLEAEDGRQRVIMGSANMSFRAFGGVQRENICYIDDREAYEWYSGVFSELLEESTDEITKSALNLADAEENIDELPISQTIKAKKIVTVEPAQEIREDVKFVLDTRHLAAKLSPSMPKPEKKTGRTLLSSDSITKIKKTLRNERTKEKELRSDYPQLIINIPDQAVYLNNNRLNLKPQGAEIKNDVALFLRYMEGYNKFHGDSTGMQYRYFEFANWFFCSPFMAPMRDMAARYDQNKLPYPVFGLVYGQSKAGKTSFLETLLLMMVGQKPKVSAPDFTRSSIEELKHKVQGTPIIVDDLTNTRFNQHAIEMIKNDDFGAGDHLINYSAVVISANEDVKAVALEIIRRTVICRVEAGLTNTEVLKNNAVRTVQRNIGTALYREYLGRMLEILPDLMGQLQDDNDESPDILKVSSEIICNIIREYSDEEIPAYIRSLSLENYFSENVTGKFAIKTIRNAWKTSKESFQINRRNNELRYNAGATYEADRLMKELPETLEPHKSREWVVMNLEEAQKYFELTFKKSWLPWRR